MSALLSCDIPGRNFKRKDSLVEHLEDCQRMHIAVSPPDVNASDVEFAVQGGGIRFGLSAIKGCGGAAAEAVVAERRRQGPFRSLFDFCERVDPSACNRAAIETLIKAGAFDCLGARRSQVLAALDRAMQSGASVLADRRSGQKSLFDAVDEQPGHEAAINLPDIPEWSERERLLLEKETLGFYLSNHPLAEHQKTLAAYCTHTTSELANVRDRGEVVLGGMLSAIRISHVRNPRPGAANTKYANFDLEDAAGSIRCILWPEEFAAYSALVQPDAILVARGAVDRSRGDEANLIVNELIPLNELDARCTRGVMIRVDQRLHGEDSLGKIREIVRGYPGKCELQLMICLDDGSRVVLKSARHQVDVSPEMRHRLDDLLGEGNFRLLASPPKTSNGSQQNGGRYRNGTRKT
jgi:DNA polymerase-3 subunit alpha